MCNWFQNKSPTHTFAVDWDTWHGNWVAPCYFNGASPTGSHRWDNCLQRHLACEGLYMQICDAAVRKFAMILVWCPACARVRLHHSSWAGVSLGFLVRKKTCGHCSSPLLLLSTNQVIKCRYLVNHTGIYLYIWGSVLAQLFYVLCSIIMYLLTSWWTYIVRRRIRVQFSYLIHWFSHKLHGIFVIHTVSSFKTIFCVFWYRTQ